MSSRQDLNSDIAQYLGGVGDLTTLVSDWLEAHPGADMTAQFQSLMAQASAFGATTDSVHATDFIAVGAAPAQSGAVRLSGDEWIMSRTASATDAQLIRFNTVQGIEVGQGGYPTISQGPLEVKTSHVSIGTNPAQSGAIRLATNAPITWRNGTNTGDVPTLQVDSSGFLQVQTPVGLNQDLYMTGKKVVWNGEIAAPAAPAANSANMWLQDNGSGKSQLMIQFATGAAIAIATQV